MRSGLIIAVCGVDGIGKSTLCAGLKRDLADRGGSVSFFSRAKVTADRLDLTTRYVLPHVNVKDPWYRGDFAKIVSDGLVLDFVEGVHKSLMPEYRQGKTIICDRYTPCYFAYAKVVQRASPFELVLQHIPPPDLVLYLSAVPAVLAERQQQRGGTQADESPILQREFDRAYRSYLNEHCLNWIELDAGKSAPEVLVSARRAIEDLISLERSASHG